MEAKACCIISSAQRAYLTSLQACHGTANDLRIKSKFYPEHRSRWNVGKKNHPGPWLKATGMKEGRIIILGVPES